jgi:hypothetical protein
MSIDYNLAEAHTFLGLRYLVPQVSEQLMPYQIIYVNEPAAKRTHDDSDLPENYR